MALEDILIPEAILATGEELVRSDLQNRPLAVDPDDAVYGAAFRHYWLLTYLSPLVAEEVAVTEEVVFYNRYFWLARMTQLHCLVHGPDAGLEQMLFQMLEHPPTGVDWALLEDIDHLARGEPSASASPD